MDLIFVCWSAVRFSLVVRSCTISSLLRICPPCLCSAFSCAGAFCRAPATRANRQAASKVVSRNNFIRDSPFRCLWTVRYAERGVSCTPSIAQHVYENTNANGWVIRDEMQEPPRQRSYFENEPCLVAIALAAHVLQRGAQAFIDRKSV